MQSRVLSLVKDMLQDVTNNREFYDGYLSDYNVERISSDFKSISKQFRGKNCSILDIGAIPPLLLALLEKEDIFSKYAVADPNVDDFKDYFEKHGVEYYKTDITKGVDDRLREKYDVVCLNEVLEHLPNNILEVIRNVSGCLKKDGYLYLTTPVLNSLTGFFSIFLLKSGMASKPISPVREQYEKFEKYGYYGHLREYTNKEVINLISSFGFELVRYESVSFNLSRKFLFQLVKFFEKFFPSNRLFGKYLFKKVKG